jgi:hypothetical protein
LAIEWPDRLLRVPDGAITITIEHRAADRRSVGIKPPSAAVHSDR